MFANRCPTNVNVSVCSLVVLLFMFSARQDGLSNLADVVQSKCGCDVSQEDV